MIVGVSCVIVNGRGRECEVRGVERVVCTIVEKVMTIWGAAFEGLGEISPVVI